MGISGNLLRTSDCCREQFTKSISWHLTISYLVIFQSIFTMFRLPFANLCVQIESCHSSTCIVSRAMKYTTLSSQRFVAIFGKSASFCATGETGLARKRLSSQKPTPEVHVPGWACDRVRLLWRGLPSYGPPGLQMRRTCKSFSGHTMTNFMPKLGQLLTTLSVQFFKFDSIYCQWCSFFQSSACSSSRSLCSLHCSYHTTCINLSLKKNRDGCREARTPFSFETWLFPIQYY